MKLFLSILLTTTFLFAQNSTYEKDTLVVNLDQITITATRYPEKLMEIPYAVSILGIEQLSGKRNYGLDEVLNSIPGVFAQSRSGNQDIRLVIRGYGARGAGDRSNYGTSRGIRVMVDGIPETEPDGRTSFDLVDLSAAQNIEVVRSNASAIWGNASGGVLNISTIPTDKESFITLNGSGGSFGFTQFNGIGMSKFSSGKIYASITNTNYDGWRDHSSSFRSIMNMGITSSLDQFTNLGVFFVAASNVFHVPGPLTQKQFDANPVQANQFYLQRDERCHNKLGRIGVTLDHQFDETNSFSSMIFASPKYLQRSERGTFRDFTRYHVGGNFIYRNQIYISDQIQNHILLGVDEAYQDGAILFYSLSSSNGRGDQLKDNKREGANTFGTFIQDEILVNEKFSLILGARYDKITYYSESFINPTFGLQDRVFDHITPKFGITYRVNPMFSIYGNIGGGVEVPAGNETDPSGTYGQDLVYLINPLLEPILSTTYEIGAKQIILFPQTSFVKNISYNLALYMIDVKNDIIPYRGGRFYFTAGKTTRNGIEISSEINMDYGINFSVALTLSSNKYDNYLVDSIHYGKANKFANYSNNSVAGIPDLFYNFNFSYQPFWLDNISVSLGIQSVSNYYVDDANQISVPSHLICNAKIGLREGIKLFNKIGISGFIAVNNLFDTKYVSSAFINPDILNGEAYYLEPGLPRNFVVSLRISL